VLTNRHLSRTRDTVEFVSGDLEQLINGRLKPKYASIWVVGGAVVAGETLRRGLADEVRYSIMPIALGEGIAFFDVIGRDVPLHLLEVKAYKNGMVALRHEVKDNMKEAAPADRRL
jgi:dihydrofolate reductase